MQLTSEDAGHTKSPALLSSEPMLGGFPPSAPAARSTWYTPRCHWPRGTHGCALLKVEPRDAKIGRPGVLMRLFFICQRVPFPPDRGDKITTFNEIRHLSTKHEVHVFCLADGSRDLDNIPDARRYAQSVTAVPVGGWTSKLRALKAMFTGHPLSVAAFSEARLHYAIRQKFGEL